MMKSGRENWPKSPHMGIQRQTRKWGKKRDTWIKRKKVGNNYFRMIQRWKTPLKVPGSRGKRNLGLNQKMGHGRRLERDSHPKNKHKGNGGGGG